MISAVSGRSQWCVSVDVTPPPRSERSEQAHRPTPALSTSSTALLTAAASGARPMASSVARAATDADRRLDLHPAPQLVGLRLFGGGGARSAAAAR